METIATVIGVCRTPDIGSYPRESAVGTIIPFLRARDRGFDENLTRAMGEAFDAACKVVPVPSTSANVREAIANRIIDAAAGGERNPALLLEAALGAWRK